MVNPFRKKKRRPMDFSVLDSINEAVRGADFSGVGSAGPSIPIDDVPPVPPPGSNRLEEWRQLGEEAWKVLQERRLRDLFPTCDDHRGCSEFLLYWDLIRRSSLRYRREIFVGLRPPPDLPSPIFVPRSTFDGHAYILGKPARGKTSQALATLLLQLAYPESDGDEPAALVIIDLKPQGDRFLRAIAELIASQRGQELRFFSNSARYESLLFDPWSTIASQHDVQAQAETIFKGLSLIHPESQDAVFFMNEQRFVLEKALLGRPRSLRELIAKLETLTRGKGANSEARGAHGALQVFENATNVVVDTSITPSTGVIDFRALLDNREVLYVHLESDEKFLSSQAIGKFILSCLLTVAKQRREDDQLDAAKVYVAIDEFHRLAAHNVVSFLETSRDLVHFILSHQSPESLRSKSDDLFRLLYDITSFQQYLSLSNSEAIELLRLASSRRSEFLKSTHESETDSTGENSNWTKTRTTGHASGSTGGNPSSSSYQASSIGIGGGYNKNHGTEHGEGQAETKIPGLTPEMIARVDDPAERVSLIVSWGETDSVHSPLAGTPTLTHRIFPFSKPLADEFRKDAWPLRSAPPPSASQRPRLMLPGNRGTPPSSGSPFNQVAEDLFNSAGGTGVRGKRSRASGPKKNKKKPKSPPGGTPTTEAKKNAAKRDADRIAKDLFDSHSSETPKPKPASSQPRHKKTEGSQEPSA